MVIGSKLAQDSGLMLNSVVTLIDPAGHSDAVRPGPRSQRFRVAGIFETNFYDVDDTWAYASLAAVQKLRSLGRCGEHHRDPAGQSGSRPADREGSRSHRRPALLRRMTWEEQNRQLFHALKLERVVTSITIGLIEMVGALNILITLTMIVLTKYKDIAVLMSMGARRGQIRRIFVMQGAMIGVIGTAIGLVVGYAFCYFAGQYHWIPLDESVYALSYVPFEPRPLDGFWITAVALGVSLLATLYPARNATRITPVEVLTIRMTKPTKPKSKPERKARVAGDSQDARRDVSGRDLRADSSQSVGTAGGDHSLRAVYG